MAILKYPVGDLDRDNRLAPRRDSRISYGAFGVIVYIYQLALETRRGQDNSHPQDNPNQGRLYHPVDTLNEAIYWLDYYKQQTIVMGFMKRPLYEDAWFVPNPNGEL